MRSSFATTLWTLAALPKAVRFWAAVRDVQGTQDAVLQQILQRNADTEVGRRFGFADIDSVRAFRARVPLQTYADVKPDVDRIAAGADRVLTADPVRLLEPTSGSTAATKYVPYTAGLQADFQKAVAPWIVDLFRHHPRAAAGPAFWSVSPVGDRPSHTEGGIPIGFDDDSAYLGRIQGALARAAQAVPPAVQQIRDPNAFRYVTLLGLLHRADLALVSVWSPTFFTLLLDALPAWGDRLARDVAAGTCTPPGPLPEAVRAACAPSWRARPSRAAAIRTALRHDPPERGQRLWPKLAVVSCWTDGPSAPHARALARRLPHAHLQPKGLLATEGVITIPQHGAPAGVPAVRSHFFEFLPTTGGAPVGLADLETGADYDVVLTTSGGLTRYRLNDRVRVAGRWRGVPCLQFLGKADRVSDRFGEKLHAAHVQRCLDRLRPNPLPPDGFALLAPDAGDPLRYTLFAETDAPDSALQAAADNLEAGLCENYHYAYCRRLGQLGPASVVRVPPGAAAAYQARCVHRGQRPGDVKPAALDLETGWREWLV